MKITIILRCPDCQSTKVKRNGKKASKKQNYLCKHCGRQFIGDHALSYRAGAVCTFGYSTDGKKFADMGGKFTATDGKWIGAKVGVFCTRPVSNNDGGRAEIDRFQVDR